jgi:hypothetical protein
VAGAIVACALIGCGGGDSEAKLPEGHYEGDGHDHSGHYPGDGHDHSGHDHAAHAHGGQRPAPIADAKDATSAAYQFLEAIRLGQQELASSLFSEKAREATQHPDMYFSPSGSPLSKFRLGQVTQTSDGQTVVACQWTESDIAGVDKTEYFSLLVRESGGQWRITGMQVKLFDDKPPFELNFENRDELLKTQQEILAEAKRREQPATEEVSAPAAPAVERTSQDPFQVNPVRQ